MKIVFVHNGIDESLAIEYLSAVLKKAGHNTDVCIFSPDSGNNNTEAKTEKFISEILDKKPDLIAFSVFSDMFNWSCDMARAIKERAAIRIIFGGFHPTSAPEKVIKKPFIDFICIGEGEDAIVELVDAIEHNKNLTSILNIWAKINGELFRNPPRPLLIDLDSLPYPDKDLFYRSDLFNKEGYAVIAARGCPQVCSYCHNSLKMKLYSATKSQFLRCRSVDDIMRELMWAKNRYPLKRIYLIHDQIGYDIKWFRRFVKLYKEHINLPFECDPHPSIVNAEFVSLLDKAGCAIAGIGVQTISEKLRREVLHRFENNSTIGTAINLLNKSKVLASIDIMLGIPFQDEKELLQIADFLNRFRPDHICIFWLRYYPGTEISEFVKRNNLISSDDVEKIQEGLSGIAGTINNMLPVFDSNYPGLSHRKEFRKLALFILISPLLPRPIFHIILQTKLFKIFPPITLIIPKYYGYYTRVMFLRKRFLQKINLKQSLSMQANG